MTTTTTTFTLANGDEYTVPASIAAEEMSNPDGSEYLYGLTKCCNASAKGTEHGIACRACYQDCPDHLGGEATLAIAVARYEVGPLEACEPTELAAVDGIKVTILDGDHWPGAVVEGPTADAVVEYVRSQWGDDDKGWFQQWVVDSVRRVGVGFNAPTTLSNYVANVIVLVAATDEDDAERRILATFSDSAHIDCIDLSTDQTPPAEQLRADPRYTGAADGGDLSEAAQKIATTARPTRARTALSVTRTRGRSPRRRLASTSTSATT